jgi:vitamin K-dependent gamma-carboxylase-like protein
MTLGSLAQAWNGFFHASEPAHTIALFRILLGGLLLSNAMLFRRDARFWVGPSGVLGHDQYCQLYGHSPLTLLRYLPPVNAWVDVVLGVHVLAACGLTLGVMTHWSAGVAWLTLVSLHHRNPLVTYGADEVMRIMTFLLVFSRAGEVLSIDHWWAQRTGHAIAPGTAWCTRLMQLQVSIVYFQAFLAKFSGRTWLDGTAVYYAVEVPHYRRARLPSMARNLTGSRLMTWWTLVVEGTMGPVVWIRELRPVVLASALVLHLGMEVFMNLHLFGPTMIVCLTLFLDPHTVERLATNLNL